MTRPSPLRGVVFDLDGTLYDKQPLEWFMVRSMPLSLLRLLRYTRVRTGLAGVDLGSGPAIARETLGRLSHDPDHQKAWARWIAEVYEPAVIRGLREASTLQPGVQPLLATLRAAGVRLGLVSDYRGVPERLEALGLAPASFDFVLVTEDLGAMKPAPRMVELTLAGMGLPGSAMVMVGDRAFADQRFAEAAGMRFLGVRRRGKVDDTWMPWSGARDRLLHMIRPMGHVPDDMP
jgi:putative hydrolase of the HAD superfamily